MATLRAAANQQVERILDKAGKDVKNPDIRKLLADVWLSGHLAGADAGTSLMMTAIGSIFARVGVDAGEKAREALLVCQEVLTKDLQRARDFILTKCREDPETVEDLVTNALNKVKPKEQG